MTDLQKKYWAMRAKFWINESMKHLSREMDSANAGMKKPEHGVDWEPEAIKFLVRSAKKKQDLLIPLRGVRLFARVLLEMFKGIV
jgi:hypothetical protein